MVSSIATLYKKLRLETHENIGWGKIHLPEIELHTTSYWVALGPSFDSWRRDELDIALSGAGRAMQTVASILLMSDPHDIGMVAQVRSPHAEHPVVYLYDGVPGGVGLAERLFDRHDELLNRRARPCRELRVCRGLPGLCGTTSGGRWTGQGTRAAASAVAVRRDRLAGTGGNEGPRRGCIA